MHAIQEIIEKCKCLSNSEKSSFVDAICKTTKLCPDKSFREINKMLTWPTIIALQNQGVDFFPHTKTHPILTQCSPSRLVKEIYEPKKEHFSRLGKPSNIFCYPNGKFTDFNENVINILKKAGYKAAFTAEEAFDDSSKILDLFMLKRYPFPNDVLKFKQLVSGMEFLRVNLGELRVGILVL